ncbi:MAG: hypothetical protein GX139_01380 [Armatimonadetes bacterium]|jgi:hypothetical protein|nr:hypothetical protein [Armatimonadota bacterium]
MRQKIMLAILLTIAVALPVCAAELVPPPAIYMPAGGKIVTEINASDDDVLGIVKRAIPALADVAKELSQSADANTNAQFSSALSAIEKVDLELLSSAIRDIRNIRVIVVKYPKAIESDKFLAEFTSGAAKAGPFRRVMLDIAQAPGVKALYALPDNAGWMGFLYMPAENTAYAVRIVGGFNVEEFIKFAGNAAKAAAPHMNSLDIPVPDFPKEPAEQNEQQ